MKKKDIEIGKVYACKVSGKIVPVKILFSHLTGWSATNMNTGRELWIKTAARLLYPMVWWVSQQKYVQDPESIHE